MHLGLIGHELMSILELSKGEMNLLTTTKRNAWSFMIFDALTLSQATTHGDSGSLSDNM